VSSRRRLRGACRSDKNTIYFGGLLHDIGKVVLDRFPRVYKIVIQVHARGRLSMIEAEKRIIGESHDTVGG
jgi:HD-like signal output (HDOD) protein